jgi:hypothetical protein
VHGQIVLVLNGLDALPALQHRAAAQRPGLSAPGSRGGSVASPCAFPSFGARLARMPELTSGWTNQQGQAKGASRPAGSPGR